MISLQRFFSFACELQQIRGNGVTNLTLALRTFPHVVEPQISLPGFIGSRCGQRLREFAIVDDDRVEEEAKNASLKRIVERLTGFARVVYGLEQYGSGSLLVKIKEAPEL